MLLFKPRGQNCGRSCRREQKLQDCKERRWLVACAVSRMKQDCTPRASIMLRREVHKPVTSCHIHAYQMHKRGHPSQGAKMSWLAKPGPEGLGFCFFCCLRLCACACVDLQDSSASSSSHWQLTFATGASRLCIPVRKVFIHRYIEQPLSVGSQLQSWFLSGAL